MRQANLSSEILPVLVVGAGVAGLQAALNLANLGIPVHLVEQGAHLGGQVLRLDKVYPTDHCAFCPTWPLARACQEHPLITLSLATRFTGLDGQTAVLKKLIQPIDADECIFCGACIKQCPAGAIGGHAPDLPWDPSAPPVPRLDLTRCDSCGQCVKACPTNAIALNREEELRQIPISDVIFAGGFNEPNPAPAPEFGGHSHPDILTAMAFEALTAEFAADPGSVLYCPSDKRPVKSIAFIQCAGARDKRYLAHCSAVCCMHAAKQASWMKRRQPELDLTVFYTDLRAPGKGQEGYARNAEKLGVRFYRRRPGLVAPVNAPRGIAVRHEADGKIATTVADIVVLNGGLACCPYPTLSTAPKPAPDKMCGFCSEPADIAQSVIQAGNAAALAFFRSKGNEDTPTTLRKEAAS
jgi:heterodisulfide reductase subunit A